MDGTRRRGPGNFSGSDFLVPVATRKPAGIGWIKRRLFVAHRYAIGATRCEAAARGHGRKVRRQAFDRLQPGAARAIEPRHRAQQAHGVGMSRAMEDGHGGTLLDPPCRIHYDDAVGVACHYAEIMRDDNQRDVELPRQVLHQFQNLRLDGDIERGCRLIGDNEFRIAGKPDCDHHALAHATRKLVRVLIESTLSIGNAHKGEQLNRPGARLFVGHAEMDLQRLGDLQSDGENWISEVIGSWKIIEMSRPRSWRICSSSRSSRLLPSKTMRPLGTRAV